MSLSETSVLWAGISLVISEKGSLETRAFRAGRNRDPRQIQSLDLLESRAPGSLPVHRISASECSSAPRLGVGIAPTSLATQAPTRLATSFIKSSDAP